LKEAAGVLAANVVGLWRKYQKAWQVIVDAGLLLWKKREFKTKFHRGNRLRIVQPTVSQRK